MKIIIPTTKEHFEKYRDMAAAWGITPEMALALSRCKTAYNVRLKLLNDSALNNIPMQYFDALPVRGGHSMSDNTCVYKHVLIFGVVGAEPMFCDTYRETLLWKWRFGFGDQQELPSWMKPDGTEKTDAEHSAWLKQTREERAEQARKDFEAAAPYRLQYIAGHSEKCMCADCVKHNPARECWACKGIKKGALPDTPCTVCQKA